MVTFAIIIIVIQPVTNSSGRYHIHILDGPKLPASRSFSANENSIRNRMGTKRIGRLATEIFVPALCQAHQT